MDKLTVWLLARRRLALMLVLFGMILVATTVTACGRRSVNVDVLAPYRPSIKPALQHELNGLENAPRYAIDVSLDPSGELLLGTATVDLTNNSPDPWSNLVFRLYPALSQYGGRMTIQSVQVDQRPSTFIYQANNTAILIDLAEPLATHRSVSVRLTWKLEIPTWPDTSSVYALFGRSQQMISLPLFYPSVAVYVPGPAVGAGDWWLEQGSVRGDAAFNVSSFFVVTATLPSEQVPVTSGTLISTQPAAEGQTRYVWVSGPSREFLLHMSPLFTSAVAEAYGTRITSYWLPGQEAGGRSALDAAVAALRIYSDYFGEYPFRDMRVAPAPLSYRGMEYPQVNLLGVELYGRFRDNLDVLVAHEVAHQWWYQIVHNDPVQTPWLDEALAEYSVKLYYEWLRGERRAGLLQLQRWQGPLDLLVARSAETPIDRPVDSFENSSQYETIIYAKGALFYEQLRLTLGDREFKRFLQEYLRTYRYQIVDTQAWLEAVVALQNPTLETLYREWVEATATQLPSQQARDGGQP